ncbi:transposase [Lampropedia puyangensis]|uniref:Transposase n=1 Tax=Lampropedia puyangensis TaxID=1330072 RepID=A0A4S8EUZ2_9BURK|nr:transposase [Lampropedia puyangensis]THT98110.1 transposase [Lampropedia puyangensis]
MARLPRLLIPHLPHHVILRSINKQSIFLDAQDYAYFLDTVAQQLKGQPISLHAYVLLDHRIHLLLTPENDVVLSKLMQGIGRHYVRYFNQRYQRFGTLWEGRFRAGPMQPAPYVLAAMTLFDWLPVTEAYSTQPKDYAWSSHRHWSGFEHQKMLTPHPLYWSLADTPFGREAAYQTLVGAGIGSTLRDSIEHSAMGGWLLGSNSFIQETAQHVPRRVGPGKPGRPRKNATS